MFPVILAHGIARFDYLREKIRSDLKLRDNPLDDELQYFRNVRTYLNSNGFSDVFNTNVDFAGSVVLRAQQLKEKVEDVLAQTGAEKVHIIAHSMGGLDARMMIVDLNMAEKVATLTSIGTPHLGTVLADRALGFGGELLIRVLREAVKLNLEGFKDLTIAACEAFNCRALDAEAKNDVIYQVYTSYEEGDDMFIPLFGSWALIRSIAGRNDGLVPVASQMWRGELIASDGTRKTVLQREFPFRADHLNQTGWWDLEEALKPSIGGDLVRQRRDYELKVRNIYLEIMQNLPTLLRKDC